MLKAVVIGACAMLVWNQPAGAFIWNNNDIAYSWGPSFREPGNTQDIAKNILTLTHADGWAYGSNFINVDLVFSNSRDPRQGSSAGARETYVVARHDFDLAKVFGGTWAVGPIKSVMLEIGGDLNSKNDAFGSEKRMPVAGVAFALDVPGFWKVAVLWDKEWNRNGIVRRKVTHTSTYRIESAWEIPFDLRGQAFTFEGYADLNGPKGRDGFGVSTVHELLVHAQVMYDLGKALGHANAFKIGAGYEYWLNKFGNSHHALPGALASTPFVRAACRFSF